MIQTYETSMTYTVTEPGTYYVTVVAYNHALDGSQASCSDGVTVDNSTAIVSDVVVNGAITHQGLVKDADLGTVYVLHRNREIERLVNVPQTCM